MRRLLPTSTLSGPQNIVPRRCFVTPHNFRLSVSIAAPAEQAYTMALSSETTEALYQKDGFAYTHQTTVSAVAPLSSLPAETQSLFKPPPGGEPYVVAVPSTIFHAQGGGQPSDTGTMTLLPPAGTKNEGKFDVHQVRKVAPSILHLGTFSPSNAAEHFEKAAQVEQNIDVEQRILHSRFHTAGHVLGLAIYLVSRAGEGGVPKDVKDGKASHYPGAAFVEFSGLIPGSAKETIQKKVDELVRQDLDVWIHFWSEAEAAEKCISGVDGANFEEEEDGVRVVDIGGKGSYPCGGTHVRKLGELGRVVVRGIKRQKGISKISYEVADA